MEMKTLAEVANDPTIWDLISYLGPGILWSGGIPALITIVCGLAAIVMLFKGKLMQTVVLGLIAAGAAVYAITAIIDGALPVVKEKVEQTFRYCETRGWLTGIEARVTYDTLWEENPKFGVETPYFDPGDGVHPDSGMYTGELIISAEALNKLDTIRIVLGITRVHNLVGPRGKYAVPFDIVYNNGTWKLAPYKAYTKAVERGEAPEDFNDWFWPQMAIANYPVAVSELYNWYAPPSAEKVVIPKDFWMADSWAPAPDPFGSGLEDERLRGSPFDMKNGRVFLLPNGEKRETVEDVFRN